MYARLEATRRPPPLTRMKRYTILTFAKGDRMKASPPGGEADMFDPAVDDTPLFAIEVVWKLSISCDMTFRWASSLKKRKYGRTDKGTWFAAMEWIISLKRTVIDYFQRGK